MPINKVDSKAIKNNAITTNKLSAGILDGMPPVGSIILWSGLASEVGATGGALEKWALCNGSNGTPDLRDKFVIGAGSDTPASSTVPLTTNQSSNSSVSLSSQVVGQQLFTSTGATTWVCPTGVTSVSVVCIGGGGGGGGNGRSGGGGGGLGWKNDYAVTPGQSYNVVVGSGGGGRGGGGDAAFDGLDGSDSYFVSLSVVKGGGGRGGVVENSTSPRITELGGSFVGDGGGNGGATFSMFLNAHGGSGAGGYAGTGGNAVSNGAGTNGTGGAGGAGGDGGGTSSDCGAGGGGVGVFGQDVDGAGGPGRPQIAIGGFGGSGGENGNNGSNGYQGGQPPSGAFGDGGLYGGGGGQSTSAQSGDGAQGAVRIIWPGDLRQFPNTLTEDQNTSSIAPGEVDFYSLAYIMRVQ